MLTAVVEMSESSSVDVRLPRIELILNEVLLSIVLIEIMLLEAKFDTWELLRWVICWRLFIKQEVAREVQLLVVETLLLQSWTLAAMPGKRLSLLFSTFSIVVRVLRVLVF